MAEAEDVITDAAEHATAAVVDYWQRRTYTPVPFGQTLKAHKKRLELLLHSLFNQSMAIRVAEAPAPPTFLTRMFTRRPRRLFQSTQLPGQDGHAIFLPADLSDFIDDVRDTNFAELAYRVFAVQQAQRRRRRSTAVWGSPGIRAVWANPMTYLLFRLSEAANADHELAAAYPGLRHDLQQLRQRIRVKRPDPAMLKGPEQQAEALYQRLLSQPLADLELPFERCSDAGDSLAWAHKNADALEQSHHRFHGIQPDAWIGCWLEPETRIRAEVPAADEPQDPDDSHRPDEQKLDRRPQVREREDDEDDANEGMWMVQPTIPMEHAEDPMGMQRPTDQDKEADSGGMADSLSELQETSVVTTPEPAKEIMISDDIPLKDAAEPAPGAAPAGIVYPEWNYQANSYIERGTTVRLCKPVLGGADWVTSVTTKNRRQLAEVRRRFEAMRSRRQSERRQIDGEEIDIAEYVAAVADRRAGLPVSERLFECTRNLRRDCAVLLLIDISGSTDAWVSGGQRIIDVAKESLVLVTSALDAVGDPYAIQAFSGEGPNQVCVTELKGLGCQGNRGIPGNSELYRRIAGLEPDRFTRAGSALRHATATLMKSPARNRLLIILSDGKPNDVDQYESRYGIEDTRQAVAEACLQGIHPFCITVDREAPDYLPYMFGPRRYAVLSRVEKLPRVLLDVLGRFISR